MQGRYPFVEPSRCRCVTTMVALQNLLQGACMPSHDVEIAFNVCRSHVQGEQKLQEIIDAGIDAFVCLQVERHVG